MCFYTVELRVETAGVIGYRSVFWGRLFPAQNKTYIINKKVIFSILREVVRNSERSGLQDNSEIES